MNSSYKNIFIAFLLIATTALFVGCSSSDKGDEPSDPSSATLITNYNVQAAMSLSIGDTQAFSGKGFKEGDALMFKSSSAEIIAPITSITSTYAVFSVPESMQEGVYTLYVVRDNKRQELGKTKVTLVLNITVPHKEGYTIKGAVYCGKEPVVGVRVSDGISTTVTDAKGFYWLQSAKKHGYVFVCTPSGYQPKTTNNAAPGFWSTLIAGVATTEQHNFELVKVNNDKHVLIVAADLHLANRGASSNNDMNQFNDGFMKETKQFIQSLGTTPSYAIVLGDMSWDGYWYSRTYDISHYKQTVSSFTAPMYHVMGNHDNDPYIADDFSSEAKYKKALGPTYYSMDIGKVHYIFLDNTIYLNKGGMEGTVGARDYYKYLTAEQTTWLQEDLAAIKDKSTPIVVSYHCPSTNGYNSTFKTNLSFNPSAKATEFHNLFNGFTKVLLLSGHTHYNDNNTIGSNIYERNVAATCETWWWSGKTTGLNVCKDGSPSGYEVIEVNDRDIKWYYKGIGQSKDKQFRVYDMNKVKEFFNKEAVKTIMGALAGSRNDDYKSIGTNSVIINVFNYDPSCKLVVKEGSKTLAVQRLFIKDPLHTVTYDYPRQKNNGSVTADFVTNNNPHMFEVIASSASAILDISLTDRFGREYTETVKLPKNFNGESPSMD